MLSNKVVVAVLVVVFLLIGFGVFPGFHTLYSGQSTVGLPPLIAALVQGAPYLLLFVIGYGAYMVWHKRGG